MSLYLAFIHSTTLALATLALLSSQVFALDHQWINQIGSSRNDFSHRLAIDSDGNVLVTGFTYGALGAGNKGRSDIFLASYDPSGTQTWITQIGTSNWDYSHGLAMDSEGSAYITGRTRGNLFGWNNSSSDVFIARYNPDGTLAWGRQFGSNNIDIGRSLSVDSHNNIFVVGDTQGDLDGTNSGGLDVFLTRYDIDGNRQWIRQLGTSGDDYGFGIAVDNHDSIYITGWTSGSFTKDSSPSNDVFLAKYDYSGTHLWVTQIITEYADYCRDIGVDSAGNIYLTGYTYGALGAPNAGDTDIFLMQFDSDGKHQWTSQFGTNARDYSHGLALDADDNIYVAGWTEGELTEQAVGGHDAFVARFQPDGSLSWVQQFGSSDDDYAMDIAIRNNSSILVTGYTYGDFGGDNAGGADVFIVAFEIPEPASLSILALGGLALLRRRAS